MRMDRPNKIPRPKTIARHFADGKYCDYPADIVLSAVNSYSVEYNSIAIPLKLGFEQMFNANIQAFAYLIRNRDSIDINDFLSAPSYFMEQRGLRLLVPFDEYIPRIYAALLEDEMLETLKVNDLDKFLNVIYSREPNSWKARHPERYPKAYMDRLSYPFLEDIPNMLTGKEYEEIGLSKDMGVNLLFLRKFFSEK